MKMALCISALTVMRIDTVDLAAVLVEGVAQILQRLVPRKAKNLKSYGLRLSIARKF